MDKLSLVREFWDETPCDGQPTFALRSQLRYLKDPWLLPLIDRIAQTCSSILEVGCGQGTDGVTLCQRMPQGGSYVGVDMSQVSLSRARSAAMEVRESLQVTPHFSFENAEQLSFADNSFPSILSVGALHHSQNTEKAISEIRRVLAPGGTAFILLYRTIAPKVAFAHILRAVQASLDAIIRTDRIFYRTLRAMRFAEGSGTAVYECFGVPVLRSYTLRGLHTLFRDFSSVRVSSHGYLWLVEATK